MNKLTTKIQEALQRAQQLAFRSAHPEFLNRTDETGIFDRLDCEELGGVVQLQLERVKARLKKQRLILNLSEEAAEFMENQGYDPIYGARPLKRAIQSTLLDPMSLALLDGRFASGDEITVSVADGELSFTK
jgi:ATP-dependent Clp protease ATP-binding subunit ClpB